MTLELGGSYRDVLKGELIDPVLRIENPGEKRIMYLGPTSALPMDFNQVFYCFFDRGKQVLSTRSIPTYLNETWRKWYILDPPGSQR